MTSQILCDSIKLPKAYAYPDGDNVYGVLGTPRSNCDTALPQPTGDLVRLAGLRGGMASLTLGHTPGITPDVTPGGCLFPDPLSTGHPPHHLTPSFILENLRSIPGLCILG
jgi:hypothetical protein